MSATTSAAPSRLTGQARSDEFPNQRRGRRTGIAVVAAYTLIAFLLTAGVWIDPSRRALANNPADQYFFEWVLNYTAHAITHGANPFFTPLMNAPLGVNIAANTSIGALGVLLTPVTLWLGPSVTFAIVVTLSLAGTAAAWFWLFSRHTRLRLPYAIGAAALCGFGPGIMSHANGHLNFAAQFLVPVLLRLLIRLVRRPAPDPSGRRRTALRDGTLLGLVVAVQYSIGAELLFATGLGVLVYVIAWTAQRPRAALRLGRRVVRPLGAALLVGACFVAYPVWMQFFGPQAYHGSGFPTGGVSENLLAFGAYSSGSVAGQLGGWGKLSVNVAEENSFFGPVLLLVAIWAGVRAWRRTPGRAGTRALVVAGLAIALLSMGPRLRIAGLSTPIPLPWALLDRLPVIGSALPGRLALLLMPLVAYLSAVALQETVRSGSRRWLAVVVGVLALLPIAPTPIQTIPRPTLPRFITSGDWRRYLPPGGTLVSIPPSTTASPDAQRWQTATDFAFPIDGGYFLGPGRDGRSFVGPVPTATYTLFKSVSSTGVMPPLPAGARARAAADLRYWHAGLIVLPDVPAGPVEQWTHYHQALERIAQELFGPGRHVDDVWIWTPPG